MFHSRKLNEEALGIVYKDFNSSFKELLIEDNSLNIHHRYLQKPMTEIFKVKNGWSPELMNDVFEFIEKPCSLRTTLHFRSTKIRITKYGIETPSYLGLKLGNLVQNEYKTIESLADFKAKIKICVPENCPCRLCKTSRFYLISPHDDSQISIYLKKMIFTLLRYMIFPFLVYFN